MGKKSSGMKIGILTADGDCPGINATIRVVGKTAIVKYGMKLIGISDGFVGMINKEYRKLTEYGNQFWRVKNPGITLFIINEKNNLYPSRQG